VREIHRGLEELGLKGIAVDPFLRNLQADDASCIRSTRSPPNWGLPAVITVGPLVGQHWSDPVAIDHVAEDFPTLKILLSHGCYPQVTELIVWRIGGRTSTWSPRSTSRFLAPTFSSRRLRRFSTTRSFGLAPSLRTVGHQDEFIKTYDLSGNLLDKILGGNAASFLGL